MSVSTKKVVSKVTLSRSTIELALDYIGDEMETLLALSNALVSQVTVQDPKNPKDHDNVFAFRLAELLEDRIASSVFQENIRHILGVTRP